MRVRAAWMSSIALALGVPLLAQIIPPASIADKEIGWLKIYDFQGSTEPLKVDVRVYTPAQRTIAADLANWMQASYSPIGGLGDVVRTFPRLSPAAPQSYGVAGKIYTDLKYGANRKVEPYTNSHNTWDVMVNGAFGEAADKISTPERYYFTIPTFAQQGYSDDLEKAVDLSGHPFLGQFPAWFQRNSFNGNRKFVLLAKDRRLPFVKLTRGEYLDAVGVAITRAYDAEKRRITEAEQGNQERIARFFEDFEKRTAKRRQVSKPTARSARTGCRKSPRSPPSSPTSRWRISRMYSRATAAADCGCPSTPLMPPRWRAASQKGRSGSWCPGRHS